jgi:hypothetical protein
VDAGVPYTADPALVIAAMMAARMAISPWVPVAMSRRGRVMYDPAMRIHLALAASLALLAVPALGQAVLSQADKAAAFRAGGFGLQGGKWSACGDPGTAGYTPGAIEIVRDVNGDGRPEAILTEGSAYCFGAAGTGFKLVSKQADGTWKLVTEREGVATFLETKGVGGWLDIEIGGPGFCFPVERWNGRQYALSRHQYEGKPCRL